MRIEIETSAYNARRHGKPWIASVSIKNNKLVYEFGSWIGYHGEAGMLVLEESGLIFAEGQKDHRKNNPHINFYKVVGDDWESIERVEAFKLLSKLNE